MKEKKQKGFTLIEILVVIAIIGLLVAIMLVSVMRSLKKSRDRKRITEINALKTQASMYYSKYGQFPTGAGDPNFKPGFVKDSDFNGPNAPGDPADVYTYTVVGANNQDCTISAVMEVLEPPLYTINCK